MPTSGHRRPQDRPRARQESLGTFRGCLFDYRQNDALKNRAGETE